MPIKVVIPSLGLTMEEAAIIEWLKQEGQEVTKDEPIVVIETDKANVDVEAPGGGIIGGISAKVGDTVPVGEVIALIYSAEEYAQLGNAGESPSESQQTNSPIAETAPAAAPLPLNAETTKGEASTGAAQSFDEETRIKASPAARKLARELQVELQNVTGTGPGGRIIESDVAAAHASKPVEAPNVKSAAGRELPLSRMRKTIAERMLASSQSTSPVTMFASFRMDEAVRLREQMNRNANRPNGIRITYDAIFAKALTIALTEFPAMQAQWGGDRLLHPEGVHIGIAVALPSGLVVPVITDADKKSLFTIAKETRNLATLAKEGKLSGEQMQGGTFTISNLGMYPVKGFTPVINLPEAAILGIGEIADQAVVRNGVIEVGKISEVSLTFDHRIVDGADAAQFVARLKTLIEEPYQLFMEIE